MMRNMLILAAALTLVVVVLGVAVHGLLASSPDLYLHRRY